MLFSTRRLLSATLFGYVQGMLTSTCLLWLGEGMQMQVELFHLQLEVVQTSLELKR